MRKFKLFSKRNRPQIEVITHDITDEFKARYLNHINELCSDQHGGVDALWEYLYKLFLQEYGRLNQSSYNAARMSDNALVEHFYYSDTELCLDFIEAVFTAPCCTREQGGIDAINNLFLELGIGYRLTSFGRKNIVKNGTSQTWEWEYPVIMPISDSQVHEMAVNPALHLLGEGGYEIANSEMLDCFTAFRVRTFDEAITKCCSAYESYMKTVCTKKGLAFDPQRDTCSKLVAALIQGSLVPEFYRNLLESVGTIRNKIGSAHGRGPVVLTTPEFHHVDHLINLVCTNIMLIHSCAK